MLAAVISNDTGRSYNHSLGELPPHLPSEEHRQAQAGLMRRARMELLQGRETADKVCQLQHPNLAASEGHTPTRPILQRRWLADPLVTSSALKEHHVAAGISPAQSSSSTALLPTEPCSGAARSTHSTATPTNASHTMGDQSAGEHNSHQAASRRSAFTTPSTRTRGSPPSGDSGGAATERGAEIVEGAVYFKHAEELLSTRTNSSTTRTCSSCFAEEDCNFFKESQSKECQIEEARKQLWQLSSDARLDDIAAVALAPLAETPVSAQVAKALQSRFDAMATQEVLRLSAALDSMRNRTKKVRAQMDRAATECQHLETRLDGFGLSRRRREREANTAWREVMEAASLAETQLIDVQRREDLVSELADGHTTSAAVGGPCPDGLKGRWQAFLRGLRREAQLREAAVGVLRSRCERLEEELAALPAPSAIREPPTSSRLQELLKAAPSTAARLRSQLAEVQAHRRENIARLNAEYRRQQSAATIVACDDV